jgi:hypothetical protein
VVRLQHVLKGGWGICEAKLRRHRVKCGFHDAGHVHETDGAFQKSVERDFLGGVEDTAGRATGLHDIAREPQRGISAQVGGVEFQRRDLRQVDARHRQVAPFGPVQRIADGVAHVGRAQMRHQRPVAETDQRVHDGLGMDHGLDLLGWDAEELLGFNQLHGLVEHRRAVDRDALAHVPVRMRARVGHGRLGQRLQRPVAQAPARGRDDDLLDRRDILAHEALEDRGMLAVDGQDRGVMGRASAMQERPRGHEAFLVGERQRRAVPQRPEPRRKPRGADDRGHDPVGGPVRGLDQGALPAAGLDTPDPASAARSSSRRSS